VITDRLLLGPGPSNPYPEATAALGRPLLGHMDPEFLAVMDETMARLRTVFRTENTLTLPISGTGSAGMETCFVNLLEPGDTAIVGANGVFGDRMCEVARRCGAEVVRIDAEWGRALDPQRLFDAHAQHPNQIFWVATVQEEIGLRGAHTASDVVKPEIGIAIEGGVTRDAPKVGAEEAQELLGGGPAIFLYDSSALPNLKLVSLIKQTAKEKSIPLQSDLIQGYGDDSSEMQKSNGGAPTVNMVVPVRYTHSHNGIMNRGDFDKMVDLLVAVLQKLDAKTVANLRDFTPQ